MEATERELLVEHLAQTRERLVLAVEGLSEAQRTFRPAEGSWSIADCIEHVTIVEANILRYIQKALQEPPDPARQEEARGKDQIILERIPTRVRRVASPSDVVPQGRWSNFDELMRQFEATRERSVRFSAVTQADLRNHFFPHPFLGLLDCYQWLLMLGAHCERHVRQMEEVKSDPQFPAHEQAGQAGA